MASAPAPSASISASGSFWNPSRTRPDEPTQIAPDFSTTGSSAAARPPVIGSFALPRATRLETTTRFTALSSGHLTAVHQYGSFENCEELKPNSDCKRRNPGSRAQRKYLMQEKHVSGAKNARAPQSRNDYGACVMLWSSSSRARNSRTSLVASK